MRTLSGAVLVLVMALGTGGIGCSDGDADVSSQLAAFEASIDAAQAAADSASAAAASAQGTADSASAAANNAQNAANNAQGTATSAQNSANTAQDAADLSQSAAAVNAEFIATLAYNHRFLACADGLTVEDQVTGLLWERKTGTFSIFSSAALVCETAPGGCADPHDVNNLYAWSSTGTAADGNAYTDFLATLNTDSFAGHSDWRLPFISELQSIMVGISVETVADAAPPDPVSGQNATAQSPTCAGSPCIDLGFAAVGGPTAYPALGTGGGDSWGYWSASSFATNPLNAWSANFLHAPNTVDFRSGILNWDKTNDSFVRAVRTGSCAP